MKLPQLNYKLRVKNQLAWRKLLWLYGGVFILWSLYRWSFNFDLVVEELVIKGLIFGAPVLYLAFVKDGWNWEKLGIRLDSFSTSVLFGVSMGVLFAFIGNLGNFVKYGGVTHYQLSMTTQEVGAFLILAIITAFWEELFFMGYILQKLKQVLKDEATQVLMVGALFALIHVPALVIVQGAYFVDLLVYAALLMSLAVGNAILMLRFHNLVAPIMTHVLWGITLYVFQ